MHIKKMEKLAHEAGVYINKGHQYKGSLALEVKSGPWLIEYELHGEESKDRFKLLDSDGWVRFTGNFRECLAHMVGMKK